MNRAHFSLKLRTDRPTKNGKCSIYLYANINGKTSWYTTNNSILPKYWNNKKQEVKATCPNWIDINNELQIFLNTAKNYISTCNINGEVANKSTLDKLLRTPKFYNSNYIQFVQNYIDKHSVNYAPNTLKEYRTHIKKITEYKPDLDINDIGPAFWIDFETYLRDLGNKTNTIHKQYKHLKKFLNLAVSFGIIKKNTIAGLKVKQETGNREFLTIDEVKKLQIFFNENSNIYSGKIQVLRYFLFACYTGLRYSDVKQLKYKNILYNDTLKIIQKKTNRQITIPLNTKAKKLIDFGGNILPEMNVFKVFTGPVTNRYLKQVCKDLEIQKHITFHCARHTFATITLSLTGDIAITGNFLGHSKLSTTQEYAKVLEIKKQKAMKLWDKF